MSRHIFDRSILEYLFFCQRKAVPWPAFSTGVIGVLVEVFGAKRETHTEKP